MTTIMGASAIVYFTAVNDLHFYPVALLSINSKLVPGTATAVEGAASIETAVRTHGLPRHALINVFTHFAISCQCISGVAGTSDDSSIIVTLMHASPVARRTWIG